MACKYDQNEYSGPPRERRRPEMVPVYLGVGSRPISRTTREKADALVAAGRAQYTFDHAEPDGSDDRVAITLHPTHPATQRFTSQDKSGRERLDRRCRIQSRCTMTDQCGPGHSCGIAGWHGKYLGMVAAVPGMRSDRPGPTSEESERLIAETLKREAEQTAKAPKAAAKGLTPREKHRRAPKTAAEREAVRQDAEAKREAFRLAAKIRLANTLAGQAEAIKKAKDKLRKAVATLEAINKVEARVATEAEERVRKAYEVVEVTIQAWAAKVHNAEAYWAEVDKITRPPAWRAR